MVTEVGHGTFLRHGDDGGGLELCEHSILFDRDVKKMFLSRLLHTCLVTQTGMLVSAALCGLTMLKVFLTSSVVRLSVCSSSWRG